MAQIRVLTLDKDQFNDTILYRLEKGEKSIIHAYLTCP